MFPCTAKDLRKGKTILANEVIIAGSIGPYISRWPYWATQIFIAGPGIGPAIITSLAKIVITLLKSFENPGPGSKNEKHNVNEIVVFN